MKKFLIICQIIITLVSVYLYYRYGLWAGLLCYLICSVLREIFIVIPYNLSQDKKKQNSTLEYSSENEEFSGFEDKIETEQNSTVQKQQNNDIYNDTTVNSDNKIDRKIDI